jgi:TPR repeat protein
MTFRSLVMSTLILILFTSAKAQPSNESLEFVRELEASAESGNFIAQFHLGNIYLDGIVEGIPKDIDKGFQYLLQSAEAGYPEAQYNVAASYKLGNGVPQSAERALYWYMEAAKQGHANSQLQSALLLQSSGDYIQAMELLNKAANAGSNDAQFVLATAYYQGKGIPVNFRLAYIWYSISAASGDQDATTLRDLAAAKVDPTELSRAQTEALEIFNSVKNGLQP